MGLVVLLTDIQVIGNCIQLLSSLLLDFKRAFVFFFNYKIGKTIDWQKDLINHYSLVYNFVKICEGKEFIE